MERTKYLGKDNYGSPKSEYLEKLAMMDDTKLQKECESMIWLSAYANNNPRSKVGLDALIDEGYEIPGDKTERGFSN